MEINIAIIKIVKDKKEKYQKKANSLARMKTTMELMISTGGRFTTGRTAK